MMSSILQSSMEHNLFRITVFTTIFFRNRCNCALSIPLLPRIIIAIILGVVAGSFVPGEWLRVFATFNGIFSQLLGFLIPLIIIGLVTPAIADIGRYEGRSAMAGWMTDNGPYYACEWTLDGVVEQ